MALFFTIFFTVYTALNYYVFIRGWQALASYSYLRPYYIIVFVLVAYGYVFSKLLYKLLPPLVYDIWLGVGAIWFAFLVYFILTLLLIDIVRLLDSWFHFLPGFIQNNYEQTKKISALVVIAAVGLIVLLGNLNKRDITVKTLELQFPKGDGKLSEIASLGMILTGAHTFAAARLSFLVLAAMIPIVAARLSYELTRRRDWALLAGIIAALSGFYLAYLPTTDAFGLYMFFGAIFFLVLQRLSDCLPQPLGEPGQNQLSVNCMHIWTDMLVLGSLAGLMHLTRADGILWLVVAVLFTPSVLFPSLKTRHRLISWGAAVLLVVAGYLLVMGPWLLRNLAAFGSFLSPGGGHALWITSYDVLFTYPASLLTPAHWWESGLGAILSARLWAIGLNLQTMLGVQGQILLFP